MEKPALVRYYRDGWYYGYLLTAGRKWATVRRILPLGAKPAKRGHLRPTLQVQVSDMEVIQ